MPGPFCPKRLYRSSVAIGLVLLVGCAGPGGPNIFTDLGNQIPTEEREDMSDEQRQLLELARESERIRLTAAGAGGVVGTGLGALICEGRWLCIGAFGAGGIVVGYYAGYYLARKKEDAERQQGGIIASIEGAKASQSFYEARADAAQAVVDRNTRRIQELNQTSVATEEQRQAYAQELRTMHEDRQRISALQSQLSSDISFLEIEIQGRGFAEEDTTELEVQKAALENINERLRQQLQAMDRQLEQVPSDLEAV